MHALATEAPEFMVYSEGIIYSSVCSQLSPEETTRRFNAHSPSGTDLGWQIANENFRGGQPNPCPCSKYPETNKHYLFVC